MNSRVERRAPQTGLAETGGFEAVHLRVAERYINRSETWLKPGNTLIVRANLTDVASMIGRRGA
jgi:hypothetical protein